MKQGVTSGNPVNAIKFGWGSNFFWLLNNPVGYVYFTDSGIYQPIYKSKDISFVTEISGWEVPIVNSSSYSDMDGGEEG